MSTANPRITVTLQPEVHAVLRRLSQLTKNSQSAIVGDLLMESLPVFERMAEVLDAAEQLRLQGMKASDEVKDALSRAQGRMETQLGLVLDDFDAGNRPLLAEAERVQRRGAGGRDADSGRARPHATRSGATPLSNRGVRSGPKGSAKAVKATK